MTDRQAALRYMLERPAALGRRLGYTSLTDELHGQWLRMMLLGDKDMTLQAHRGSYKTTCLCIALAVMLVVWPDRGIIFLRKTDADVCEVIRQVGRILADGTFSALAQAIHGVPVTAGRSTATEITTSVYAAPRGAVQLLGIGLGGSLTGKHADIIVTDDIVNAQDRVSQAERERTKRIYMELQNIRNPGGRIINTGTPWHREDAFSIMPEPVRFDCYQTGMISREQLASLRASMTPSLFAANYELKHIAAENALFATTPRFVDNPACLRDGIAHIDAAYGGEDYTALTCGRRRGDTIYLYGRLWPAHVDTVLDEALHECRRLMCAPVYVETNGDKGYLAREIQRRGMPAHRYAEKMNKYQKIAAYLRKWWGNVVFLEGTDRAYIEQIMDYTGQAEHDDACLAPGTIIATMRGDMPIERVKAGDYVLTPAGARKVLFAGKTGVGMTVQDCFGVKATENHKFFDWSSRSFAAASRLNQRSKSDRLTLGGLIAWKRRLLFLTAKPMSEIRRADITLSAQREMRSGGTPCSCTVPYGHTTMGLFRQVVTSIMWTAISTITTLPTWLVYRLRSIWHTMASGILTGKSMRPRTGHSFGPLRNTPKRGTGAKREEHGTADTPKLPLARCSKIAQQSAVPSVGVFSKRSPGRNFAAKAAKRSKTGEIETTDVYNLTVQGAGCYYANGVLVSNCDSAACVCRALDRKE